MKCTLACAARALTRSLLRRLALLAFTSSVPIAYAQHAISQQPRYPTETDVVLATFAIFCSGPIAFDERIVVVLDSTIDIKVKVTCNGVWIDTKTDTVQLGFLRADNYTLRLSAMFRTDPGLPYGEPTTIASNSFKVLPSTHGDDLSAYFKIPVPGPAVEPVFVRANDLGIVERLEWSEITRPLDRKLLSLSLNSPSDGSRPAVELMPVPMAADASVAGSMYVWSEFMKFFNPISYSPPVALPGAERLPALTVTDAYGSSPYYTAPFLVTRSAPVRRNTYGVEFDAVVLSVQRYGYPWRNYLYALKLGLVGVESRDSIVPLTFLPVKFPAPTANATVVEFLDTEDFPNDPGGHYFYSTDAAEQAQLDAGAMGRFHRTGRSFPAGGYVRVCRFFGSTSPGPNSHFFSADANECDALKAVQKVPRPGLEPQWNYEGSGFEVMAVNPGPPYCGGGLQAIYRLYNNAFDATGAKGWSSNHRYTNDAAGEVAEMVAEGWRNEGVAFCVPAGTIVTSNF